MNYGRSKHLADFINVDLILAWNVEEKASVVDNGRFNPPCPPKK
jgi:hypothetical protein